MDKQTQKCPTFAESGISLNIHLDDVNELEVITEYGSFKIHKGVILLLQDHRRLMASHDSLSSNYYPELDYDLHRMLMRREFKEELAGGHHG
jgi:hypothetical protein